MTSVFSDMPKVSKDVTGVYNKGVNPQTLKVQNSLPATSTQNDTVEISNSNKEQKRGPIKSIKHFIANVKKSVATASEYSKGLIKGITSGVVFGSVVYTGGSILKNLKPREKGPLKVLSKIGKKLPVKLLAIVAVAGAIIGNLWNASLNATEKSSEIDHRWTGHNQ